MPPRLPPTAGATRLAIALPLLGGSLSCGSIVGRDDTGACRQTYEFGNTGCLEIAGHVVGLRGQPLAGVSVGLRSSSGREVFAPSFTTTNGDGAFAPFRVTRMVGGPPASGPDTVSLWVHAADAPVAGVRCTTCVRDSLLVQATVSPIGATPVPVAVRLTLPVP